MFFKILSKRDNYLKYKTDTTTCICYMYNLNVYNTIRTFYAQREKMTKEHEHFEDSSVNQ